MKTLRLLITEKCNRNCPKCCNKQFGIKTLPVCYSFKNYKEIILTGGEPMLSPSSVRFLINSIRKESQSPIYMYTAKVDDIQAVLSVLFFLDGITVTIHEEKNWDLFFKLNDMLPNSCRKSLRLNVFKNCNLRSYDQFNKWKVKDSIEWLDECPLPVDEVFMRLRE